MMQTGNVTTPFGRRSVSLALVRRQQAVEIKAGKSAEKWKIFRDVSAAMTLLGIQSNSLAVLDALLSFLPDNQLRQGASLIVFPSNVQLSLRAHQMAGSTLRRHLSALVDAGLILRKDSANGKRYARRRHNGDFESAFGFDLSPLLFRAEEFALLAQQIATERSILRKAKEDLTICRRDVRKLLTAAVENGIEGDWNAIEDVYFALLARLGRTPSLVDINTILTQMQTLKNEIVNRLQIQVKIENESTNAAQIEQHIQNSDPESFSESEPGFRKAKDIRPAELKPTAQAPLKAFPLGLILKAFPQIVDYGAGGTIANWRDLMSAAVVVRSMLGISPSAHQEACEAMGPENAAVAVAGILERANTISSHGGYLRDLARRARQDEFSLGPMIMASLKAQAMAQTRTG